MSDRVAQVSVRTGWVCACGGSNDHRLKELGVELHVTGGDNSGRRVKEDRGESDRTCLMAASGEIKPAAVHEGDQVIFGAIVVKAHREARGDALIGEGQVGAVDVI